jgi:hypothetical protein
MSARQRSAAAVQSEEVGEREAAGCREPCGKARRHGGGGMDMGESMATAWILSRETWAWGVHWGLVAWDVSFAFCLIRQKDLKDTAETQNRNGKSKQKWQAQMANRWQEQILIKMQEQTARPTQSSRAKVSPASERCIPGPTGYLDPRSTSTAGSEKLRTQAVSNRTKDQMRTDGTLLPLPGPLLWVMVMATAARSITPSAWLLLRSSPAGYSLASLQISRLRTVVGRSPNPDSNSTWKPCGNAITGKRGCFLQPPSVINSADLPRAPRPRGGDCHGKLCTTSRCQVYA